MKRAIFDLIKKAKLNLLDGGAIGKKNAMMNDNLNVCLPSVCAYFLFFSSCTMVLCFIVALMLFTINHKS